jgi:type VI protein secretion system component VasA
VSYKDPHDPRAKEARQRWYQANKERQIQRQNERKRELVQWVRKQKTKCERCGFDHPAALVFHHRDPAYKDLSIAAAITSGWGRERIAKEILKCEVVCANCHAIEHIT